MPTRSGLGVANSRSAHRLLGGAGVRVGCRVNAAKPGPNVALSLIDLSEFGARLEVRAPLHPGQEIELKLYNVAKEQSLRVLASLVWCRASSVRAFHVGLKLRRALTAQELQDFGRQPAHPELRMMGNR